ncbi:hypothetical protein BH23GEM6_BH23GEM6_10280 [soil metagenome]
MQAGLVEDFLRALSTATRSFRLYGGESPMLGRFVEALKQKLTVLFDPVPLVRLHIDEEQISWEGRSVYPSGSESADLPFLFYKDGIRVLTLLSGFESEAEKFLALLSRAPLIKEDEDDLVTLLWQADFEGLRYEYVEPGAELTELSTGSAGGEPAQGNPGEVRAAAAEPSTSLNPDEFQESLYFLDDAELRQVAESVRQEVNRDLVGDVLAALFDRLEDGDQNRQIRILQIINELLPSMLSSARFGRSAKLLQELVDLASRPGVLSPPAIREIRTIFGHLARPETIQQLLQTLEEQPDALRGDSLGALLSFFPPEALAPLMRAVEGVSRPDVRRTLELAIDALVESNRSAISGLLRDPDAAIAAGAARWAGRLGIGSAAGEITNLLKHPSATVRTASIVALQELRAAAAGRSLEPLLNDEDREVRIAAVRALASLEYVLARPALESIVSSKEMRAADRTEKLAFFESYGRLAAGDGVSLLNKVLNGKSWLGRGESAETRACAALALGCIRQPSARAALTTAANDPDPVVRTAVARALRAEAT